MEKIIWMSTLILFGVFSLTRVFYWYLTPRDELYSYYRNEIDRVGNDFALRLWMKRTLWLTATIVLLGSGGFLFFS